MAVSAVMLPNRTSFNVPYSSLVPLQTDSLCLICVLQLVVCTWYIFQLFVYVKYVFNDKRLNTYYIVYGLCYILYCLCCLETKCVLSLLR